jgi:hypothetical protein
MRTTIEVPVLSAAFRELGVPLSLVTTAEPTVYVSGLPPTIQKQDNWLAATSPARRTRAFALLRPVWPLRAARSTTW